MKREFAILVTTFAIGLLIASQVGAMDTPTQQQETTPKRHVTRYSPSPAPTVPSMHPIQLRLIEQTNAERARYGLAPLAIDMGLVRSAERHTAWMTNSRSMQHTNAMVAENIAMGQRSVAEVVQSWMNSPGHRANMLGGNYRRIGVAAYRTPDGTIYWCQQFAN